MSLARELREAPLALADQESMLAAPLGELAARLRRRTPSLVMTCARGSSAHAATFAKHLIERHLGLPVAAAAPGIASVYGRPLHLAGQLFLAISQSGSSDDLVTAAAMARGAGALAVAIVNETGSPLAAVCDIVLPMGAGSETSVAATKSFVASLAALVRLVALWSGEERMQTALDRLPKRLRAATELDWQAALPLLGGAPSAIALGRGPTLAIAREAALKLKEVTNLHAEAFSGAEFLHGPVALVSQGYPLLMLLPSDEAAAGMRRLAADLAGKGAALLTAGPGGMLPTLASDHPATDAICLVQSFYAMVVQLAERRRIDPERPRHLRKVTRTR